MEPMARQGGGSMINISSIYGVVANDPTLHGRWISSILRITIL